MNEEGDESTGLIIRPNAPQTLLGSVMQMLNELNHTTDSGRRLALMEGIINTLIPNLRAKSSGDEAFGKLMAQYNRLSRLPITVVRESGGTYKYKVGDTAVATFPSPSPAGEKIARNYADEKYMLGLKTVFMGVMEMAIKEGILPWTGAIGKLPAAEMFREELESEEDMDGED